MERNMSNNWVPLHEAASRDHYTCVNALLQHGLPDKPRTADNQTPLDLALEARHAKTVSILKYYMPPEPKLKQHEFLHEAIVTREIAKYFLEMFRNEQGVYLVRKTQRNENILVLSLMWNNEFFNYEICVKEELSLINGEMLKFFYIDDGPYFRSLAHLIEHYTKYEDGLPGVLKRHVEPGMIQHLNLPSPINGSSSLKSVNSKQSGQLQLLSAQQQQQSLIQQNGISQQKMSNNNSEQQFRSSSNHSGNGETKNFKSSDALTKAHLFKSRTLLNDQS